jgi:hypothetical protein
MGTAVAPEVSESDFLLSYGEAARRLGVCERTIARKVKRGDLLAVPISKHPNARIEKAIPEALVPGRGLGGCP